ncbi:MAG: glycosyltransferase family protein [Candidatus Humimicrobiaceae bacterium]
MLKKIKKFLNKFRRLDWILKHILYRLSGKEDELWNFNHFDNKVNINTWNQYDKVIIWAKNCKNNAQKIESKEAFERSEEPVVRQGYALLNKVKDEFNGKLNYLNNLKILIHVPSCEISPAGFSIFNNLIQSFNFLGIKTKALNWNENVDYCLEDFKPSIFLTSDDGPFLDKINWNSVSNYKLKNNLKLGLTASLTYWGNSSLSDRLKWAKENKVDFYYSFEDKDYLLERKEYEPYFADGYQIFTIPFGVNPLIYFPVPNIKKDLDYVFITAKTFDKWPRFSYIKKIVSKNSGFISGTGWKICGPNYKFDPEINRFIYSRAKIGLNLHLDLQIQWANELNERTYALAACGVPQLIDHPKILFKEFTKDCFFIGDTPDEYEELFYYILENSEEASGKALKAQEEVFNKYTMFHRSEKFINDLVNNFNFVR